MTQNHWSSFNKYSNKIGSPFSPHQMVIDKYKEIGSRNAHSVKVLVLGATGEVIKVFVDDPRVNVIVVVDKSIEMIESKALPYKNAFPPDRLECVLADWLTMDLAHKDFDIVVGDGCFNSVPFEQIAPIKDNILLHMKRGGVSMSRVYFCPSPTPVPDIFNETAISLMKAIGFSFSAFRMLLMMRVAFEKDRPNITTKEIFATFERGLKKLGVDYEEFAKAGGWSHEVVESIRIHTESNTTFCFPSRDEFNNVRGRLTVDHSAWGAESYEKCELSENCPILTMIR